MHEPETQAPLRVALLSPCYWPEVRRGTERFTRELATGLIARGQRPALITSHPGRRSRTVEDGLPVLRLPRPPERMVRGRFESYVSHVPLTYLALRGGSYDIAHAVYPSDALAAARWRRHTSRPALLSYMGIPNLIWLTETRGRLEILTRAIRGCDAVVVLSHHAAAALRRSLHHDARVIPPGVDVAAFTPAPARAEHPTIVCSAALEEPRKNVRLLVDAFARVRRARPQARLVLSRPRDPPAADRAAAQLASPGVELVDLDDHAALARHYGEAWVAALPAVDEAFGLVLVEALACGTPVVGYAGGGIPEVIDRPEIGRLFGALDADTLARALLESFELAQDPATVGRCRVRASEFSTDRCTERYLALYRELHAGAPGTGR